MTFTHAPESRPLDGYSIKRGIGRGAYGEVYYAVSDGGKDVALKLIQQHVEVELRGVRECLNLEHPNLVRLYDVQQTPEGESWVVMEYCDGESLEEAIAAHPNGMPIDEVLQWFRGICAGIGFLHEHGIVHRDLKPSHIFRENGVVKICDYGLAKFISVSRRSGNTDGVGTVYYSAPEMAKGRYGKELDLYSMGVMLYEALSGDVPFDGETAAEILMKHLFEKPNVDQFPPPYRQIVSKLLEKEPQNRFRSVEELTETFNMPITGKAAASGSLLDNIPIVGRVVDKVRPKQRACQLRDIIKRNKLATLAILGACSAMLAIGIAIGEANRYRSYHYPYGYSRRTVSTSDLQLVNVRRSDNPVQTVRLSEVASFNRIGTLRTSRGQRISSSTYVIGIDGANSTTKKVGRKEVLEAMWNAGIPPMLEVIVNAGTASTKGVTRRDIERLLESYRNRNSTRRHQVQILTTKEGFVVQFRRDPYHRRPSSSGELALLDPSAVYQLQLTGRGPRRNEIVPLLDVSHIRILAGSYR